MPAARNAAVFALVLISGALCAAPQTIDPALLDHAIRSSVLIRADRVYQGMYFPTNGTGFFVTARGLVLTNWHVVADTIQTYEYGTKREIDTKVIKLDVVVGSGTESERVIPATVVTGDAELDLALLSVRHRPEAFLDVGSPPPVRLTEPVWVVGFPFGELLAVGRENPSTKDSTPEISVNTGRITSLRRDGNRKLVALQTDASVNPGNSGGPMINIDGRVVGVVNSMIAGGQGLGFAISPNLLDEFSRSKEVAVKFKPLAVFSPPRPITVTVRPILADLEGAQGYLQFDGSDVDLLRVELARQGDTWQATFDPPARIEDRPRASAYTAELHFIDADGSLLVARRYKLDALSTDELPQLADADSAAEAMEARRRSSGKLSLEDYAKSQKVKGKDPKSLADYAKDAKLKKSPDGTIVIDDKAMIENNPMVKFLQRKFPEGRYDQLTGKYRELAAAYDMLRWSCEETKKNLPLLEEWSKSHADSRTRSEARQAKLMLERGLREWIPALHQLVDQMIVSKLVFCVDENRWYFEHACPCDDPVQPSAQL
jgi:hypothetical protein